MNIFDPYHCPSVFALSCCILSCTAFRLLCDFVSKFKPLGILKDLKLVVRGEKLHGARRRTNNKVNLHIALSLGVGKRDRTAQGRRVLPTLYPTRLRGEGL